MSDVVSKEVVRNIQFNKLNTKVIASTLPLHQRRTWKSEKKKKKGGGWGEPRTFWFDKGELMGILYLFGWQMGVGTIFGQNFTPSAYHINNLASKIPDVSTLMQVNQYKTYTKFGEKK